MFWIVEVFNDCFGSFFMDFNIILFVVVMVGVVGFIIFEVVKLILEELNFEIFLIEFLKLVFFKFFLVKLNVIILKGFFCYNF